ncbi:MAG: transcriptional repressor [Ignavibacteriae bacterium]|nr:MAG: transcriptional repressor [Ignavibacteriota bacterium]
MEKFLNVLRNAGAKITKQRKLVLEELSCSEYPLTLKEIHHGCSKVDFASVYRIIELFKELNIVKEINFADKKIRFELNEDKHHHHIICSECGKIKEIPVCFLNEIKNTTNYKITNHNFELIGICPQCQN